VTDTPDAHPFSPCCKDLATALSFPAGRHFFIEDGKLKMDLGRAGVVHLPEHETQRRWDATTPQWPIMHAVTYGITRDQMMARHKSNHIQVAYAPDAARANLALATKAATFREMGLEVAICGIENGLL